MSATMRSMSSSYLLQGRRRSCDSTQPLLQSSAELHDLLAGYSQRQIAASKNDAYLSNTAPADTSQVVTFHARKSHLSLRLETKKTSNMCVQLDTQTRLLTLISKTKACRHYPCEQVVARPYSTSSVQLRVNKESKREKISFESTEERAKFLAALESMHATITSDKLTSSCIRSATFSDADVPNSDLVSSSSSSISPSSSRETIKEVELLEGEDETQLIHRVSITVRASTGDIGVNGTLRITNYRLIFTPQHSSHENRAFQLPIATIDSVKREGLVVVVEAKTIRTLRLAMHEAFSSDREGNVLGRRFATAPDMRWVNFLALRMMPPTAPDALFAFDHHAAKMQAREDPHGRNENGWHLFHPVSEYRRLGFLPPSTEASDSSRRLVSPSDQGYWRLYRNRKYRFCPSYPEFVIVPSHLSEDEFVQSAKFRSRSRLPVAVWRHPTHQNVLVRSSQPKYGVIGNRCEADRCLLQAYREASETRIGEHAPVLHIVDARKPIATRGNRLRGKGVENPQHYDNARVTFLNIANIHKMRESFDTLKANIVDESYSDVKGSPDASNWLKHIICILAGARHIAEVLHEDGASVLVHCSDGWDRTPQLTALAQLMLDPYYRTIRGFAVLVEKEWCSFGHKFADRIGVGKDISDQPSERSPVMLQFLDCVWQMTQQFPTSFEFDERLLLHIYDGTVSGLYGTFLYNSECHRTQDGVRDRTESVWTPVLENESMYKNVQYEPSTRVVYPRANVKRVLLWEKLYCRNNAEEQREMWVSEMFGLFVI